ncbi:Vesicle-associated protein 2-1 [Capsicum annuum]|uniref:Vesicle-associated protein 2-1 n=1 Tax=Capsicum annuum TaxID=4072 RepID=A0A1U8GGP2_CAPAN|nr:vesicle-associated protein 2-1 [Capsicum annuum]XP_016570477.1 vesicle-associated protein 2-1 [Capsicum annuum]PHT92833.1 Vesicle-associated protein 2-1 [Capsicum annuum]
MTGGTPNQLISVSPEELKFQFEPEKQSCCDLKVTNNTDQYVAFKVKTTSPKKYFVRPNTGIVHPGDSCFIRVTLQAQKDYPPDMQCKDKFLLQSTIVNSDADDLPPDTFNRDSGRNVEECKLRVVYASPHSSLGHSENAFSQSSDVNSSQALQHARDERDAVLRQTQQLQQELEMLKRRRNRRSDAGFSVKFALVVGLIGLMAGFLFKLLMSSPSTE